MSIFLLPKGFCQDLNSILRKFWWGFPLNKNHNLTLLAWDNICKPKSLGGLGIRSLDTMNLSLLAKLGWNLTIKKPMLWVKALVGKYLNFGQNFLNVAPKPLDSWLWKGLLNSRSIVEKGACLAISMGSNINVWSDPWIPTLESFKPSPNPNLVDRPQFFVEDLIIQSNRSWNSSLLEDLFDMNSVNKIKNIHIPLLPLSDRWTWIPAENGIFSVRSAHELTHNVPPHRSSPLTPEHWKVLWRLKMQHRLKHLLWKLAWNILPVRQCFGNFIDSNDQADWFCPICKTAPESSIHLFLECGFAKILWRNSPWPFNSEVLHFSSFADWIKVILKPSSFMPILTMDIRLFQLNAAITMDHIWFVRNKLVHDNKQPNPIESIQIIANSVQIHKKAWSDSVFSSTWAPPLPGNFKANFDVAVKNDFSVAAMVLSDSNGKIIHAATKRLSTTDASIGEAQAALLASQIASSLGIYSLILEGDAINIILAIQQPDLFLDWNFASIISDIQVHLLSLYSWKAIKVSRSANFRAHSLARWAASNLVFGSIPNWSPILSSIRIRSGFDHPL
jgi:hypothetical protein